MPKLTKPQIAILQKNPAKFTFDPANLKKLATPADRSALAGEIAQAIGRNKSDVLAKLNQAARVSIVTIDW